MQSRLILLLVAAAVPFEKTPEFEALSRDFKITGAIEADVDGDTLQETVIAFRDVKQDNQSGGGILVLKQRAGELRNAGCAWLDGHHPVDVAVDGNVVTVGVVKTGQPDVDAQKLPLTIGKELVLRGEEGDPFANMKITASSTLKGEAADVKFVSDGDFSTSWAEGARGTGIGESLTFEFRKPVHIGLMAILGGNGAGLKEFKDANRIRHLQVEVKTSSTSGDSSANLDFADLGLSAGGNKTDFTLVNKPELRFLKVQEEEATSVILRIESVFLGDTKDDTHVAEVAFCSLVTDAQIQAVLKRQKKAAPAPVKAVPSAP